MAESKSLVKNTTIYALGDIFPRLLSFISFPILTSYLTPADYGIVNYVTTLNTFLMVLGFLGVNTYFLVHFYRCKDEMEQKRLLGNLFTFVLGINLAFAVLLYSLGPILYSALGSNISFYPYIAIGLAIHFFNLFAVLPSALYRILEKPLLLTAINISKGIITLLLILLFVVYLEFTAIGVLYATLLVNICFSGVFIYTTRNYIVWNLNLDQMKTVLKFSLPLIPGSLAYYVTTISDRILIEKFLDLNDLGIYSTAATLAMILHIISYGAYKAFEPYIFKHFGETDFLGRFVEVRDGYVFVLLFGAFGIAVFSREFFTIFSSERFHEAYWYVPLILIGVFASSMSMLYGTIITAKSKTRINSLINTVGAGISISLNLIFLPQFGVITAALVSSFAMSIMFIISKTYAALAIQYRRPLFGFIVVGFAVYLLVYLFPFDELVPALIWKSLASIAVFMILSQILDINPLKRFNVLVNK